LLEKPATRKASRFESSGEAIVRAPMPAQIQAIHVMQGDVVEKGETLMLLEAMKMEIRIQAPIGGKIQRLPVQVEQSVDRDQVLVEISENK
jgi:biotin carboxyl carrier protein